MAANKDMVLAAKGDLAKLIPELENALPATARKYLTPERMVKVALLALRKNPTLLTCSRASVLEAVMDMAALGLEIGGALGHAYLVPFKNQAVPIIGYRGYIALARRSGEIESVKAEIVHQHDEFKIDLASGQPPLHVPCLKGDRGPAEGVYCVARFKDGGMHVEYMTVDDVKKIQARSPSVRAKRPSPWDTDWNEMAKKTVVRRAAKYWPLSIELADLMEMDNRTDGVHYSPGEVIDGHFESVPDEQPSPATRTDEALEALKQAPPPDDEHIHQPGQEPPGWVKAAEQGQPPAGMKMGIDPAVPGEDRSFTQEYPPEEPQTAGPPPSAEPDPGWSPPSNVPTGKWSMEHISRYYSDKIPGKVFDDLKLEVGITKDKRRDNEKRRDQLISACEKVLDEADAAMKKEEEARQTDIENYTKPRVQTIDKTKGKAELINQVNQICFEADPQVGPQTVLLMVRGVTGINVDTLEAMPDSALQKFIDHRRSMQLHRTEREPGQEG